MSDPKAPSNKPRQTTSQPQEPKPAKGDPQQPGKQKSPPRQAAEGERDDRSGNNRDGLE